MSRITTFIIAGLLFSSSAWADRGEWRGGHHHHHHNHHRHHVDHYYPRHRDRVVYVPGRVVEYVPVQPRYYAPPPPAPVYYNRYDRRTPQGLVGGVIGSAMGYELGNGDPVAAGIGAAAGAWFGNGMY
ncbi:hypothetical protein [Methylomonas sp. MgM2]